jgi:hypothetical protein
VILEEAGPYGRHDQLIEIKILVDKLCVTF